MTVAKTRSAAEDVVGVQIEISRLAAITPLALNVIFTRAGARLAVASWLTAQTSGHAASARPTSLRSKVVEIGLTSVAFVTRYTGLTLALAIATALQTPRSCKHFNINLKFTSTKKLMANHF